MAVDDRRVLIIADGAQGRSGGDAAEVAIEYVEAHASEIAQAKSSADCERVLAEIDRQIVLSNSGGLTTAVLIVLDSESILGASVGDSEAHLVGIDGVVDLTERAALNAPCSVAAAVGPSPASPTLNDDQIIEALRAARERSTPVELAELHFRLSGGGPSQAAIVAYFKRAFPEMPLWTLLRAGAWSRVSGGGMSDDQFNSLLAPWLTR